MQKLAAIEDMDGYLVDWIHNFLLDRSQQVVLNGTSSGSKPVTSGVPQGSVLGPTLFLVYINDLPEAVDCSVSLFADDTLLYQAVNNTTDELRFQSNIDSLQKWASDWSMSFNDAKCHIMGFNAKRRIPLYITLGHVTETKYLGVTLQSNLRFDSHITNKISKARQQLGVLRRALHWVPKTAKLLAYKSLCRPHLEYASASWDPFLRSHVNSIEIR